MENVSLMKVESIAEYFWPALSEYRYWKPIFGVHSEWPLKTGFTVVLIAYAQKPLTNVYPHVSGGATYVTIAILVRVFINTHYLCMRAENALASLRICAGSP